ncbi:UNVERIFIED_CONTAM: DDB1- and CUL4-associated factor 13 [Sesamum angustifolium]|uniref:DDB1- and CUL4-associated factor 13 n=1 Tax=Sesamum angustifolium TaxID=2727405 RepID=A0AAW2PDY6_9LAMI
MKVKVISRSTDEFTRERSQDLQRVFRNFDPTLRTQEKATEYVRALSAAKLDKIFARPFIGAMDGHIDAVSCMAKNPNHLKGVFSGSMDGDIRLWDLATSVRLWNVPIPSLMASDDSSDNEAKPLAVYVWKYAFWAVDHQWDGELFATAGAQVDIWNHNSDRSITIYDLRLSSPARKIIMSLILGPNSPSVENLLVEPANEDCNCYSYDARKLDEARCVHKDHVSAVMDIDYSPTGREFVTGSYDRTVRIFQYNGGHSREIYHTKRMQRVFCVKFSCDASYVISGSDDTNLRLWKAKASEQLGVLLPRERKKHEYLEAVKNRYKHLPEVKRIVRHRHLPKAIYKAASLRRIMTEAERKRTERRRAHSAPGSMPKEALRKRRIIKEVE